LAQNIENKITSPLPEIPSRFRTENFKSFQKKNPSREMTWNFPEMERLDISQRFLGFAATQSSQLDCTNDFPVRFSRNRVEQRNCYEWL